MAATMATATRAVTTRAPMVSLSGPRKVLDEEELEGLKEQMRQLLVKAGLVADQGFAFSCGFANVIVILEATSFGFLHDFLICSRSVLAKYLTPLQMESSIAGFLVPLGGVTYMRSRSVRLGGNGNSTRG